MSELNESKEELNNFPTQNPKEPEQEPEQPPPQNPKEPEQEPKEPPPQNPKEPGQEPRQPPPQNPKEPLADKLRRLLVKHPKILIVGWCIVLLAFIIVIPLAYLCWYFLPIHLWKWANDVWWHWLAAWFGFLMLFVAPIWGVMIAFTITNYVTDLALWVEEIAVRKAKQTVHETEQEAINRLEQTDQAGLLPLLKYSRAQLDAYYEIGLNQTRRSFFNAVLAMWLGFALLLVGIALYVGPVEKLGLARPTQDFQILILAGATIIEFISALFLWVYRNTTAQLTFYYKRQMHSHTSILCFRMASTMQQSDDAKRAIIDKVLDWTEMPVRPPLAGTKGLRSLLPALGPKAAT